MYTRMRYFTRMCYLLISQNALLALYHRRCRYGVSLPLSLSPSLFAAVSPRLSSEDQPFSRTFPLPRGCMRKLPPRASRRVGGRGKETKGVKSRERPNRRETHRCQQPLQPPAAPAAVCLFAGGHVMGWDMVTSSGMATGCWNYSWP